MRERRPPSAGGRVLVTGADGRIGAAVVASLVQSGRPVTGLALEWRTPSLADRVVTGDACDVDTVAEALEGVEAIVHTAAIPHPSLADPYTVFRTNTAATFNVLSQAGQRGIRRAVITSSINAFGVPLNSHDVMPAYFPLDESSPAALDDWYSLSKHTDEHTAAMVHSHWGTDILCLRLPFVRELEESRETSARITASLGANARLAREGWSYILLEDAVDAIRRGLEVDLRGAPVVLVAADDILPDAHTEDLLDRFAAEVPRQRAFPARSGLVDTTRARDLLGWAPRHSVHTPSRMEIAV